MSIIWEGGGGEHYLGGWMEYTCLCWPCGLSGLGK